MSRRSLLVAAVLALLAGTAARAQQKPVAVVFFVEWSGALDDVAHDIIQTAADSARGSKEMLTVTGFADRKGSKQADIYLSQLRAQVVADALVADGVPADRIRMVAAGAMPVSGVIGRRVEITTERPTQ